MNYSTTYLAYIHNTHILQVQCGAAMTLYGYIEYTKTTD